MNQPEFVDIPAKTYMSEQEFIAHMDELIPTPSVETNNNLLDLANSLWWEMTAPLFAATLQASGTAALKNRANWTGWSKGPTPPCSSPATTKTMICWPNTPWRNGMAGRCSGFAPR